MNFFKNPEELDLHDARSYIEYLQEHIESLQRTIDHFASLLYLNGEDDDYDLLGVAEQRLLDLQEGKSKLISMEELTEYLKNRNYGGTD